VNTKDGKAKVRKRRRGAGEGSIVQRKDGRWQASIQIGYNPVTGHEAEAEIFLRSDPKRGPAEAGRDSPEGASRDIPGT